MDHETQQALIRRALANVEARRCDAGEASLRPVAPYVCPERFAAERRTLFAQLPLVVGFASQVARPGDFITHRHSGVPILVVRDEAGALRAFVNACRHRGSRLVEAACGEGMKRIRCPYHAWTYETDGRLSVITHPEGFAGLDPTTRGLVPLPVGVRHGLVWVVPRPAPGDALALDVAAFTGPLGDDLEGFGLGESVVWRPEERVRTLNWKLMADTSFESYHFATVHRDTIYPMFFDTTGAFDWRDPHVRMVLPKRSMRALADADPASWRIRDHANLLYGIFPNTIVLVQPDHAMVVTTWPEAVDRTAIVSGMLVPEAPEGEKALAHWERNREIFWEAIEEDLAAAASMQSTLASGANETLALGTFEHLIERFHGAVERVIGELEAPGA